MKTPYTIPAVIFGLLVPVALLSSAWNLLTPASWCWMPADRAAWCGAVATAILLVAYCSHQNAAAQNAPKNSRTPSDGNSPAETSYRVGKVPANARLKP